MRKPMPLHAPLLAPLLAIAGFVAAISVLLALLMRGADAPDPMVGLAAAPITAPVLAVDGAPVPRTQARLVNFWATWCTPCKIEHPVLVDLARQGIRVEGVAYRDDADKVRRYLADAGNPFSTLYFDPNGDTTFDYGVAGVPETFVIGPDGIIRARVSGAITRETLEEVVLPALVK